MNIRLLDCTLRDGAYIVEGNFGSKTIGGIIKRLTEAKIDIIECGWLKNTPYKEGSTYYHIPSDANPFLEDKKNPNATYTAMIDWDRYDLEQLPPCDGKSIDAIRIVFPRGCCKKAVPLGDIVRAKGYRVFFQAANTLGYSDAELLELVEEINRVKPEGLSIVDTFGAMYAEDIRRIAALIDHNLDPEINLGFHSHNNLQQSFSLTMEFIKLMASGKRNIMVDASLSGMGRGAGNAPTELVAGFLNRFLDAGYDMNIIMDVIDTYLLYFHKNFEWGYSTPFFLSGTYCSHVNNIAYLTQKHKTRNKDIKQILEALPAEKRLVYDYDLLEEAYVEYQKNEIVDTEVYDSLRKELQGKKVLMIAPGKKALDEKDKADEFIQSSHPIIIGINAVVPGYRYQYLFFSNFMRLEYALESYRESFSGVTVLLTSNLINSIKDLQMEGIDFRILNYNDLLQRGWVHFDNSTIMCLRMLSRLGIKEAAVAGLDGYDTSDRNTKNYVSTALELTSEDAATLNREIGEMLNELQSNGRITIRFITTSKFDQLCSKNS